MHTDSIHTQTDVYDTRPIFLLCTYPGYNACCEM